MRKSNIITMLQAGTFDTVKVRFKLSDGELTAKEYHYKADKALRVEVGDEVIVNSPSKGNVVVVVSDVDRYGDVDHNVSYGYKWVVQRVDTTDYDRRQAVEDQAIREMRHAYNIAAKDEALADCREALSGSHEALSAFNRAVASVTARGQYPTQGPMPAPPAAEPARDVVGEDDPRRRNPEGPRNRPEGGSGSKIG